MHAKHTEAALLLESSLLLTSIDDLQICIKDHGIIKNATKKLSPYIYISANSIRISNILPVQNRFFLV